VTAPAFGDDFDGPDLDAEVWVAHHLPAVELARGDGRDI
jgi:hypothetical protein